MRYAIVESNKVANTAIAESPIESNWIPSDTAVNGDTWDGSVFTKPEAPVLTPAEYEARAIALFSEAVQDHLDNEAIEHVYDGILSLCTYVSSPSDKFSSEGAAGVSWRDACWSYTYQVLADVKAGDRTEPTVKELIAELPDMVWPA